MNRSLFAASPRPRFPEALTALPAGLPVGRVDTPDVSLFEFWPSWLFYLPVVVQWLALGLRYGDLSLPTAANPRITAGGLCGESKCMILDQVRGVERDAIAPYVCFTIGRDVAADFAAAEAARLGAGLDYPLVIKPDIGCNGTGVRRVADAGDLRRYLNDFRRPLADDFRRPLADDFRRPLADDFRRPLADDFRRPLVEPRVQMMLQTLVPFEGEAGIFYMRYPGQAQGRITSITLKAPPVVIGDGRSTLAALIRADARTGRVAEMYLQRLAERQHEVPNSGERVQLTFVGNHCKGSVFTDGRAHATDALAARIERLAQALPDFHFGRFDVRFRSLNELRLGQGFVVIEVNGAGSEATHIWDPATPLAAAYATQFQHYRAAFDIGRANRAAGFKSTGVRELARLWRRQRRLLASYPTHD
jgi:hypothetical protein